MGKNWAVLLKHNKAEGRIAMSPFLRLLRLAKRRWFQILVSGLVLIYMEQWAFKKTGNPNVVPSLLLLGAFLTPVTFVAYVDERQQVRNVPLASVAVCFFWGGAVGTVLAGVFEYETLRSLGPLQYVGVGLIEETAKLIFPLVIFLQGRYLLESEGLLFGVASGMGFAALETMGYGFVALLSSGGHVAAMDGELLIRGLLAPTNHAAWTGLVCAVAWRERLRAGRIVLNGAIIGAFLAAVLLHALWDASASFTMSGPSAALVEPIVHIFGLAIALTSLSLLIRRLHEARRLEGVGQASPSRS